MEVPQPEIPAEVQAEIAKIHPKFVYLIDRGNDGFVLCAVNADPVEVFNRGILEEEIIGSFKIKEGVATLPFLPNPAYQSE